VDFPYGKTSFANYFSKIAAGRFDAPGKRVADALASDEKWYSKTSPKKRDIIEAIPALRPLLMELAADYERNIEMFNTTELLRENFRNFALLTDLARKIEEKCAAEGILPISETNRIINKLISGNDAPFIFEKAGNHFSRFMIDEFQDTSAMQWENFIPLLRNSLSQAPGDSVLLVGDVKQAIYRWRGGDWRILSTEIEKVFGDVRSEELATNYRSLGNVVRFNNELIRACVETDNHLLNDSLEEAAAEGQISRQHAARLDDMLLTAYAGHEQAAAESNDTGYVNVTYYDRAESGRKIPPVIRRIEELQRRGYRPSDIAVLVRYNAEGVEVANMLLEHKKLDPASPYLDDVVTQEALLVGSAPVVRFVSSCLRISYDPTERLDRAIFNMWFGRAFDAELLDSDAALLESLRTKPLLEAFECLVKHYRLGDIPEQATYLQAFEDQIIEFGKSAIADIPLFLKWWEENGATQSVNVPEGGQAITIITIHKAKGLQYKAVIIPYCDWKLTPGSHTVLWAEASEEEIPGAVPVRYKEKMRRSAFAGDFYDELVMSHIDNINTLYVALTRAREELHVMIPEPSKSSLDRVSALIDACITTGDGIAAEGTIRGTSSQADSGRIMEFGAPLHKTDSEREGTSSAVTVPFRSYDIGERLRIKNSVARYIEDGASLSSSPREAGILMHRAFETAADRNAIAAAIEGMLFNGDLSAAEATTIGQRIDEAFANPIIASWFSGDWDVVRSESTIIVPGDTRTRRPDRVMTRGHRAVVVDYKFGLGRPAAHARQLREYADLLRQMGYTDVEGYIWYVASGELERAV
jgi:ATP-dependent exoDNAse (exonuclease V) beta subunit